MVHHKVDALVNGKKKEPQQQQQQQRRGGAEEEATPPRPWFTYLMIQLGGRCKNEANLKVAREPFEDTRKHNSGETNDKATKPARGAWQVEMVIGPFGSREAAEAFRRLWMQKSRGPISRRARGAELVEHYQNRGYQLSDELRSSGDAAWRGIYCFDKRLVPLDLNQWLLRHGMGYLTQSEERLNTLYQRHGHALETIVTCEAALRGAPSRVAAASS